jgi:hypothetical protein
MPSSMAENLRGRAAMPLLVPRRQQGAIRRFGWIAALLCLLAAPASATPFGECCEPGGAHCVNTSPAASETRLAAASADLRAGEWCEITASKINLTSTRIDADCPSGSGNVLEYVANSAWDPVRRRIVIVGGVHNGADGGACNDLMTVWYDETTNSWGRQTGGPTNNVNTSGTHGHDGLALNPADGKLYYSGQFSANQVRRGVWNGSTYAWDTSSVPSHTSCRYIGGVDASGPGMAWADWGSSIVLVTDEGGGGVCTWQEGAGSWSLVQGTAGQNWGPYSQRAVCSANSQYCLATGYGSTFLSRIHWTGTQWQALIAAAAPASINMASVLESDPASGVFVFGTPGWNWWEYDPEANRWTAFGSGELEGYAGPPLGPSSGGGEETEFAISDHGVIGFIEAQGDAPPEFYLYKHSESSATALCSDGIDNDDDGLTDSADPGCWGPGDRTETDASGPECDNGFDDADGDGLVDASDPGCTGPTDNSEADGPCDDGVDNDGDGLIDYPADPDCTSYAGPTEVATEPPSPPGNLTSQD